MTIRSRTFYVLRNDVPVPADLAPDYTGSDALMIIAALYLQYEARQLDFFRERRRRSLLVYSLFPAEPQSAGWRAAHAQRVWRLRDEPRLR